MGDERIISREELAIVAALEPQAREAYHEGLCEELPGAPLAAACCISMAISLARFASAAEKIAGCVSGISGPSFNTYSMGSAE